MNIFSENGWVEVLQAAVEMTDWQLRLYQNDHVPVYTDTSADYVEADFSGYTGFESITWGSPFVNGSNQGEIDGSQCTFTHDGGSTGNIIYGIYVTDSSDMLLYAERFPTPLFFSDAGDTIAYSPRVTLINQ